MDKVAPPSTRSVKKSFELWDDQRLLHEPQEVANACRLNAHLQKIVVRTEEMVRWSNWRIAESQRLLERVDAATAPTVAKSQPI